MMIKFKDIKKFCSVCGNLFDNTNQKYCLDCGMKLSNAKDKTQMSKKDYYKLELFS